MLNRVTHRIAVVGAGMAGATFARALREAGFAVHVFDKSRGPGGRLATRRLEWSDPQGRAQTARLDHGALGLAAHSGEFQAFIDEGLRDGVLATWTPTLAPGSVASTDGEQLQVPVPDLPALCRRLLDGAAATWSTTIDGLHRGAPGWQLLAGGEQLAPDFDAVVLALPPAQAAPLIRPHRSDWAQQAAAVPMQPCWTLMGVTDAPEAMPAWDLARPSHGPLACVMRNDARPGRVRLPGLAQWVAHARSDWSRQNLEQPAAWVQQQLQAALADCLGHPLAWQHCVVHRWRYALPPAPLSRPASAFWWDFDLGLGACGDFLGGAGLEGAWCSARSLAAAMLSPAAGARRSATRPPSQGEGGIERRGGVDLIAPASSEVSR
ncbi:MAG TPA: NAD(P)-binding protein [Burkholderiaceae bacterium]|nr:NAD(P)-binding protein [Burkholderiaceae bacterium]